MKKSLLILLTGILSCTSPQEQEILKLVEPVPIESMEYEQEAIFANPLSIEKVGDRLYLFQGRGDAVALMMDVKTGQIIGAWGERGNGPGEFMYALSWGETTDGLFHLSDVNQFKVRKYISEKDSLIIKKELAIKPVISYVMGTVLDNGCMVVSAIYGTESPLLLMNEQSEILCSFGELPDKAHGLTDLRTYGGCLDAFGEHFVFAMNDIGYIACYEQKKDTIEKSWEHYLEIPVYKGKHLDRNVLKKGFIDVKMTSKYIYCVYSGRKFVEDTMAKNLLVFDHKGRLLKNFLLNKEIGKIAISEEEGLVYAVGYEPDICILRYEIGKYLNDMCKI